jgi:hypothetical protein
MASISATREGVLAEVGRHVAAGGAAQVAVLDDVELEGLDADAAGVLLVGLALGGRAGAAAGEAGVEGDRGG